MIRIHQIKLKPDHTQKELELKLLRLLRINESELLSYHVRKQSLDARKKPDIFYSYTVDARIRDEAALPKRIQADKNFSFVTEAPYQFPASGTAGLKNRPVIVGSGPAGLFCAYMLAANGYRPLLIERGAPVEERQRDVEEFWKTGCLNTESNVQFGEGGAGTFSDGKLNTLVKDSYGRSRKVMELFVAHGAPDDILYTNKPHVGTELLTRVVKNMREAITAMGGEVRFHSKLTGIAAEGGRLKTLIVNDREEIPAEAVVLALGHSARDTFEMLLNSGLHMEGKSFAVGVRIEHEQEMVNLAQYGRTSYSLPPASYKLTAKLENGRGVYTFCMCPGGYVVNASSEEGALAVNGMSYHNRAGKNANSAVVVTVNPADFGTGHPLAGMAFQRQLEQKAFQIGKGKIPVQLFADFCADKLSSGLGEITPNIKGDYTFANLREIFPETISLSLTEGIKKFNDRLHGFSSESAVLSGVESRTSSPVRIPRGETLVSSIDGIYPCGEGAGYAGGITSAAIDGLKTAEAIAQKYRKFDENRDILRKN